MLELRLGFPRDVPEDEARAVALAEWREANERDGRTPLPGEPRLDVIRDDPERARLGEYMIVVSDDGGGSGGDSGGDQ